MAPSTEELHVQRVLRASSHFDVLELPSPLDDAALLVDRQTVRSRYKALAVRVHPDKNRTPGAEDAFKLLSIAYDCLSNENSQREYIAQLLRARTRSDSRRSSAHPHRHHKRKRQQQTHEKDGGTTEAAQKPRRHRTPEEIWQQFQREEEEQARKEFFDRGFERVYDTGYHKKRRETQSSPSSTAAVVQEEVINSDLDAKATRWAAWSTNPGYPCQNEMEPVNAVSVHALNDASQAATAPSLICCLLCRRKFSTLDQLERHKALSALHAANLARAGMFTNNQ